MRSGRLRRRGQAVAALANRKPHLHSLGGGETSRAGVRERQTGVFGQSIASSLLKQYGKAERSGGGRVGKITLPRGRGAGSEIIHRRYANAIKSI